jgi:hypothetical protein
MKNTKIKNIAMVCVMAIVVSLGLLHGCKDYLSPEPYVSGEGVPPALASAISESISGGAKITFVLPEGVENLLYVKATYQRNGKMAEAKASRYDNVIYIRGLRDVNKEVDVNLVVGNRSAQESEPFTIKVKPLSSPIDVAKETALVEKTFGGIRLRWENPTEATTIVKVFSYSDLNRSTDETEEEKEPNFQWVQVFSDDTKKENPDFKVRGEDIGGYDAIPTKFAIVFKDVYGNNTDTLHTTKTPMPEEITTPVIPKFFKFQGDEVHNADLAAADPTLTWDGPHWRHRDNSYLWNGRWGSNDDAYWATGHDCGGNHKYLNKTNVFVTMDLTKPYLLSRYHIKGLDKKQYCYNETAIKKWRVWVCRGLTDEEANAWGPGSKWEVIDDYAMDPPKYGLRGPSAVDEDYETWKAGWERDISNNLDFPVRFVRLEIYESWMSSSAGAHIGEFRVYGNPVDSE